LVSETPYADEPFSAVPREFLIIGKTARQVEVPTSITASGCAGLG